MRKDLAKWLLNTSMNPRTTLVLAVSWVLLLLLIHAVIPSRSIESRIISPVLFKVRELLHRDPPLSPKIKIFAVDDVTVNYLQRTDLGINQWAQVITAIDRKKPRAIVIDALFGTLDTRGEGAHEAIEALGRISTPVYTGSFPSPSGIFGRTPLSLNREEFSRSHYMSKDSENLADFTSSLVYGSSKDLMSVFHRTGHLLYGDEEGSFFPFLSLKDDKVLPHIMLLPFTDLHVEGDKVKVQGTEFTLAKGGSVPINFGKKSEYNSRVRPLVHLLNQNWEATALDQIDEGDFVYLVPMFFTGNTDFKPSPIGLIPGAYAHLAVLNSILEDKPIRYMEVEALLIVAFAVVLILSAWWVNPFALVVVLVGFSLIWVVVCLGLFTYQGVILPFLLPQLSIVTVGISLLMQRLEIADRRARMIRQTLEGFVRPEALAQLQKNPETLTLSLDARERTLTVVFIDIVGFSLMVENELPRAAFEGLQVVIKGISEIIHRHGGIVNKTLGDGLLCYFGYSLEKNNVLANHAIEAMGAAFEIQRINLAQMLLEKTEPTPIFPLRIGINTGPVFMGNLGAGERVDITVVGNGVNFAKRLESACRAHSVLIGPTTRELLGSQREFGDGMKKLIMIKHHENAVESWEYDPFLADPSKRLRAEILYTTRFAAHKDSGRQ